MVIFIGIMLNFMKIISIRKIIYFPIINLKDSKLNIIDCLIIQEMLEYLLKLKMYLMKLMENLKMVK